MTQPKITIVSSCDDNYAPLAKGLYLSLIEGGLLPSNVELAFLDFGCDPVNLDWLSNRGVHIKSITSSILGELADDRFGYQRGQICRPFLPDFFPDSAVLIWIDCDAWVQDVSGMISIFSRVLEYSEKIFISAEVQIGYIHDGFNYRDRVQEVYSYFEPIYGPEEAAIYSEQPVFNSGLFAMSADCSLWNEWKAQLEHIYIRKFGDLNKMALHLAEQISLNYLIRKRNCARLFDPIYNYICLWNQPIRDEHGVVRTPIAPFLPLGVVHLAGGWKHFGKVYTEKKLLYRGGAYLCEADQRLLAELASKKGIR